MRRTVPLSAAQTAMLSGAGGLIMSLSFLLPSLFYERFHHSSLLDRALLIVPSFLIGGFLMGFFNRRLKRGIQRSLWPSADIEALRAALQSRYSLAALIVCIAALIGSLFVTGRLHAFAWVPYPLYLALSSIKTQLKDPNDHPNAPPTLSANHPAPLNSSHWGQP